VEGQSEKHLKLMKQGSASDELHRIISLGLTLGEARAWYANRVLFPRLRWAVVAFVAGSILLLSMLTEIGQLLEQSLTTRMVIHDALLLVAGFLFADGLNSLIEVASHLYDRLWRARNVLSIACLSMRVSSILTFGSAALLIAYWYLPAQFNAAASNVNSDVEMHLALVLAGGLIFVGALFLSKRLKLIVLVIVGKVLGLYGMLLLLTPQDLYPIYPSYEQVYAGTALLFLMLILDFTIMPIWLYNYFGRASASNRVGNSMPVA
jgi:hypothetical protein